MNLFFLIACTLFSQCIFSSNNKKIPKHFFPRKLKTDGQIIFDEKKLEACSVKTYLPDNYSINGEVDYTKYIQKCLTENPIVLFPDFPLLINSSGLEVSSNSILLFQENSLLKMESNSEEFYEVLRVHNVKNVKIINPNIIGDREIHKGTTGEWGMGIAIRSSENVKIYNPFIEKCWGDGIYIGQIWKKEINGKTKILSESKNIDIYNACVNFNRRNGLSIVAVDQLNVYNSIFANTRGAFPKSGIDIEPGAGLVNNIYIKDCKTFNNGTKGIDFYLSKLPKNRDPRINVKVENFCDSLSPIGIRISGYKLMKLSSNRKLPEGEVVINNAELLNNSQGGIKIEENQSLSPIINIINSKVITGSGKIYKGNEIENLKSIVKESLIENNRIAFLIK